MNKLKRGVSKMGSKNFSKRHPLNNQMKDEYVFLHGTSSTRFSSIQDCGFIKRAEPGKNFSISPGGICFEKFDIDGTYQGLSASDFIEDTVKDYCKNACKADGDLTGVILKVTGKELKKLDCSIYADWNKPYPRIKQNGFSVDVDLGASVISIIVLEKDIPIEYVERWKDVHFSREDIFS